jgi:hypothetical protein
MIKTHRWGAVVFTVALVGSLGLGATRASAIPPTDTGSGSAYGLSAAVLGGAVSIPPTPVATLGPNGQPDSASVASVNELLSLVNAGAVTASSSSTNFGLNSEAITSSSQVANSSVGLSVLGLTLPLVQLGAISSSCTSDASGATGSATVASLSLLGQSITLPAIQPNTGLNSTDLGALAGVISITLDAQTSSNVQGVNPTPNGSASITVDAVQITLLTAIDGLGLNAGTVINLGQSQCAASGPDILPPGGPTPPPNQTPPPITTPPPPASTAPVVTGSTPSSGAPSGGNPVEIVGTNLCNVLYVTFGDVPATDVSVNSTCTQITVDAPPGSGTVPITVVTTTGTGVSPVNYTYTAPGYWETATDGGVFSFGAAQFYGSTGNIKLNQPIVAMADTPDHKGYWLFAKDGGVFAFGDAPFLGSVPGVLNPGQFLNGPIVAAEASPDGKGYRMFATDGGVFDFGDADFTGSLPGIDVIPNKPIAAAVSTPIGQGYLLVAGDGGVFAFGNGNFNGSLGASAASGIVSISETTSGNGYWVFGANGAVYPFGNAVNYGNAEGVISAPVIFGTATTTDNGYWLFGTDGGVYAYGDAPNLGSLAGTPLNDPVVGGAGF